MSTLQTRITLGIIMFAVFFGTLFLDIIFTSDTGFMFLAVMAGGIGLYEFYHIAGKNGFSPFRISGIGIGGWLFVSYWLSLRRHSAGADCHFSDRKLSSYSSSGFC